MPRLGEVFRLVIGTIVISSVALLLSLVSTLIGVASFRRSRRVQEFDYATRLQIEQEEVRAGGRRPEDAFSYSAQLLNSGQKPVKIDCVYIDYGGNTLETSMHFLVKGDCHLSPTSKLPIEFLLSQADYRAALAKFDLGECLFRLRVRYRNMTGGVVETQRMLMAIGPGSTTVYARFGDALT